MLENAPRNLLGGGIFTVKRDEIAVWIDEVGDDGVVDEIIFRRALVAGFTMIDAILSRRVVARLFGPDETDHGGMKLLDVRLDAFFIVPVRIDGDEHRHERVHRRSSRLVHRVHHLGDFFQLVGTDVGTVRESKI